MELSGQMDLERRLQLLELQIQNVQLENELLKQKNETLRLKVRKLEEESQVVNDRTVQMQCMLQQVNGTVKSVCNILQQSLGDVEDLLEKEEDEDVRRIAVTTLRPNDPFILDCIDLIIKWAKLSDDKEPYMGCIYQAVCSNPSLLSEKYGPELWELVGGGINSDNMIEQQRAVEMALHAAVSFLEVPPSLLDRLSACFTSQTTCVDVKRMILVVFSYLNEDAFERLSPLFGTLVDFCSDQSMLSQADYGSATIVLVHLMHHVSESALVQNATKVVSLPLWTTDFGEEWRTKNRMDPHSLVSVLLENESVVDVLKERVNGVSAIDNIISRLVLCSTESLHILYGLVCVDAPKCSHLVDEMVGLFPFGSDVDACLTSFDVFEVFSGSVRDDALEKRFLSLADEFSVLSPRLSERAAQLRHARLVSVNK